ncbi:MAG: hypothetical protein IIX36_00980, partial [Clostridia bacterium]|nr:hypothetical protein [Clostridia bacterium]
YGLTTVGVVANALPSITPTAHQHLAEDMISHGGAIITEMAVFSSKYYVINLLLFQKKIKHLNKNTDTENAQEANSFKQRTEHFVCSSLFLPKFN